MLLQTKLPMHKNLLIYLVLLFPPYSLAQYELTSTQRPTSKIVTADDFLGTHANFEAREICSDSDGYIYFTTIQGLRKFDGSRIRDVELVHGSSKKAYQSFHKDQHNNIWLYGAAGVAQLLQDSLVPYPLPPTVAEACKSGVQCFFLGSDGTLHIAPIGQGYYIVSANGETHEVLSSEASGSGLAFTFLENNFLFHFSFFGHNQPPYPTELYSFTGGELKPITSLEGPFRTSKISFAEYADGTILLATNSRAIYEIKNDQLLTKHHFEHTISRLFIDSKDHLWIGTIDHAVFKSMDRNFIELDQYWDNTTAYVGHEDDHGGLWLMSQTISFGYIPYPEIGHYSKENGLDAMERTFYILKTPKDIVTVGEPRGMHYLGDTVTYVPLQERTHKEGTNPYDVNPLHVQSDTVKDLIWYGFSGSISSWNGSQWKSYSLNQEDFNNTMVWKTRSYPDGTLMGCTSDRLFVFENGQIKTISTHSESVIRDFDRDINGVIWVARMDGLWRIDQGEFVRPSYSLSDEQLESSVLHVKCIKDNIWIQRVNGGLDRLYKGKMQEVVYPNGEQVRLSGYSVNAKGELWCLNYSSGTQNLEKIETYGESVKIRQFLFDDHAKQNTGYGVAFLATNKRIYWGSASGLFMADIDQLKETPTPISCPVRELRVNHEIREVQKEHHLEHHENFINILFDGISFYRLPVDFRYKMEGLDSNWVYSEYQQAQYTNLAPGEYSFVVEARSSQSTDPWSASESLDFSIAKPYWETWWFRGAAFLLIVGSILLLFHLRGRYLVKRESAKAKVALEIAQLELRALKAQINPHFIFNAMSSATYYLSKNRPEDAKSYLVRFSKLIRMVLENSERSTVALKDEIELIRQYIDLESERFTGSSIDFKVLLSDSELEEFQILPALFQPYIENAIWHGLKNKEGNRCIELLGTLEKGYLSIVIEDNGIGRAASERLKAKNNNRRSFGMMIASRRIELLNESKLQRVKVEDLKSSNGIPLGTRVSFQLPLTTTHTDTSKLNAIDIAS